MERNSLIRYTLSIFVLICTLLLPKLSFAVPSNTMSITPSAVDGTVITASDENTRNNTVTTTYNAHDHNDIDQTANTVTVGDGTAGNKTIIAGNADGNQPFLRFNDTTNDWIVATDGVNTTKLLSLSGSAIGNTGTVVPAPLANGQVLILSGSNVVWAGMNTSGDMEYHNGTVRVELPIGATDNVLKVSGGVPVWGSVPATSTTGNTLTVGDGTAGNKTIVAGNADGNQPFLRFDDTTNDWIVATDGVNTTKLLSLSGSAIGNSGAVVPAPSANGQVLTLSGSSVVWVGMNTTGDMEYHNGTVRVELPIGTNNQILKVASGIPSWGNLAGGVGTFTKDTSTSTNISVTGLGFKPSSVIMIAGESGTKEFSVGASDGSAGDCIYADDNSTADTWNSETKIIRMQHSTTDVFTASISSFDNDGFTMTVIRTNSPTGTMSVVYDANP